MISSKSPRYERWERNEELTSHPRTRTLEIAIAQALGEAHHTLHEIAYDRLGAAIEIVRRFRNDATVVTVNVSAALLHNPGPFVY